MKLKRGKSQGAMEYLTTYGWAVLIVLIVGIVVYELGIFEMGSTTLSAMGFVKIKPQLAAVGLKYVAGANNDVFTGVFTNSIGSKIALSAAAATMGNSDICNLAASPSNPSPGMNFRLAGTGCDSGGKSGDVYTMTISMPYVISLGRVTTTHTETGVIRGPLE